MKIIAVFIYICTLFFLYSEDETLKLKIEERGIDTLTVSNIFSDGMVLQRQKPIRIWGWCEPGINVTLNFAEQQLKTVSEKDGSWEVWLKPLPANSNSQNLTIKDGRGNKVVINDVLIGEVWLGSGQSNMGWELMKCRGATDGTFEIADKDDLPLVRVFHIPHDNKNDESQKSYKNNQFVPAKWIKSKGKCNWGTPLGAVSAICYFFARKLHKELNIPIGIIDSSLGGSHIEPWCSISGLETEANEWNYMRKRLSPIKYGLKLGKNRSTMGLYEYGISPIIKFTMRGFIWHQGEGSIEDHERYHIKLRALVKGWRIENGDHGLFAGIGQLYPYKVNYGKPYDWVKTSWAQYRAGQFIPRAGAIVLNDHGNLDNIHPKNKRTSGERFAVWALANVYGRSNLPQGPHPSKARWDKSNKRVVIDFNCVGRELRLSRGERPLFFSVLFDDGSRKECKAEFSPDKKKIFVYLSQNLGVKPSLVGHAWSSNGAEVPNVTNSEGLPLTCFQLGVRMDFTDQSIKKGNAQVGALFQDSLRENVEFPYYLDSSFIFKKLKGPKWLNVTEGGGLYGLPSQSDLGENRFQIQIDNSYGNKVFAELVVNVTATNSSVEVTWENGSSGNPLRKVAGVQVDLLGGANFIPFNSNNDSYKSFTSLKNGFSLAIEDKLELKITNKTGSDLRLNELLFDSCRRYASSHSKYVVEYDMEANEVIKEVKNIDVGKWIGNRVGLNKTLSDGKSAIISVIYSEGVNWGAYVDNLRLSLNVKSKKGNMPLIQVCNSVIKAIKGKEVKYSLLSDVHDQNQVERLNFRLLEGPSWLNLSKEGLLTGIPPEGVRDGVRFFYQVCDGTGESITILGSIKF